MPNKHAPGRVPDPRPRRVLVGSEEAKPGEGWPFDTVLRDLTAQPDKRGRDLAATIVRQYAESYRGSRMEVTQSAIDLSMLDPPSTPWTDWRAH